MLVWSTQIPVIPSKTNEDLSNLCQRWILKSPHSSWTRELLPNSSLGEITTQQHANQSISIAYIKSTKACHFGFQYHWGDSENREWITEIIGYHQQQRFIVGVHLFCQTAKAGVRVSPPKKPYIVRMILDELGGDLDGNFQPTCTPHILAESQIDLAARIVTGRNTSYLPIVYLSSTWYNKPGLDAVKLAQWAGGMAHVIVEPSRSFSFLLAQKTHKMNPYDGAASIYWPEGGGTPSRFIPYHFSSETRFSSTIANILRKALAGRRPEPCVTWEYLRELLLKARIERIREEGKSNINEYIEAFDEELKLKNERTKLLEEENASLKRELSNQHNYTYGQDSGCLKTPPEHELFPGEYIDILVHALKSASQRSQNNGRVKHVLDSFIKANKESGESDRIEKQIRSIFSSSENAGKRELKALEDIGFQITEDGKHYKLVFRGDDRYTFSMAKTGSDWRGSKNWISDVTKRLFK